MKAAVFYSSSKPIAIEQVEVRDPGPGEVRIKIMAAGLCHSDLSVIDGTIPYPVPVVLGHEGAGIIDAVGVGVRSVKEGDTVIVSTLSHCGRCAKCDAGHPTECRNAPSPKDAKPFTIKGVPAFQFANASVFAEYTVVREQGAIIIDPRVPFDRAALIGCGVMTGFGAVVNRAQVETGATMVVFGVGGIGLNCVQGGVLSGASKIIAVDVMAQKLEWAQHFGATHVIDASATDPVAAVKDLTGGGADYSFECVGNIAVIKQALESHRGGRLDDHCRRPQGRHRLRVRRPRALPEQVDPRLPLRRRAPAARLPDARRPLPERPPQDRRAHHPPLRARRLRSRAR